MSRPRSVTVTTTQPAPTRSGPPAPGGALTPAQRKRAQRERDRAALWALGVSLDTLTTAALLEALPGLLAGERPGALGAVLIELGRRGGVSVTSRPAPFGVGTRAKA